MAGSQAKRPAFLSSRPACLCLRARLLRLRSQEQSARVAVEGGVGCWNILKIYGTSHDPVARVLQKLSCVFDVFFEKQVRILRKHARGGREMSRWVSICSQTPPPLADARRALEAPPRRQRENAGAIRQNARGLHHSVYSVLGRHDLAIQPAGRAHSLRFTLLPVISPARATRRAAPRGCARPSA